MAQVTLGVMYANGHGVPQDFVLGYMFSYWAICGSILRLLKARRTQ